MFFTVREYANCCIKKYMPGDIWKNVPTIDEAWIHLSDCNMKMPNY